MDKKYLQSFVASGLLLLLLLGFFHPITAFTQDLGRHLLTGELILRTGTVPQTNLFSYTFPDFPFINHHWGSEVIFAMLYHLSGMPGLFALMLILILAAFGLQLFASLKHASPLALVIAGLLSLGILFERTDLRPELFSFLLLSVFITLLYRNRGKATQWVWLLLPLQLLWVNLHIYFAVGLIVIGLFFVDAVLTHRRDLKAPQIRQLGLLLGGAVLVSLLNPTGVVGFLYPLHVFQNYGYTIEENQTVFLLQSLGFHKPSFPYLFGYVLLLFLSLGVNYKKTKPVDWLLCLTFTYLAFSAVRNFPLLIFATFLPFTFSLTALLKKIPVVPWQKQYREYALYGTLLCLFLWQGYLIVHEHPFGYGVTPGAEKAVNFLQQEGIKGPLFNNFDIGSYLIYRRYPQERVFVDGRPEAYPADFFTRVYIPMQQDPAIFKDVSTQYHFNTIFFSHTDQTPWGNTFLEHIVTDPAWAIVYLDDYVIILLKRTSENEPLIQRFGMAREHLHITKAENTVDANLRLASFLTKVGWVQEAVPYLEASLKARPDDCQILGILAQIHNQAQNPAGLIYAQRYNKSCL